ncbi:hypothetical protein LX87_03928 [Larkinella arboricola]|uniref:Uncharacterized protein n=1 Tax=Larkinella arboricola TaxID=643671 RepID=A0A327WP98_LARAB|nr:hypothetical protein [Larkinella arboricola]RAJ94044.1 hypothetical protein LX87_03928 [Larkinella arboricola]
MESHSTATDLLDKTIDSLAHGPGVSVSETNTDLLQQWIGILNESENTRDLAGKLSQLQEAVTQSSPDPATINGLMTEIADAVQEFSGEIGPEGELPSQLQGLATALRTASEELQ